jgi:hypothetical protein
MILTRKSFMTKLIQTILFAMLLLISYFLGSKAVLGKNCSECPGYGICKGETDCDKY